MEREKVADLLGRHAADAQLLAAEAKAWHWMVTAPNFSELHALFEQVAEHAREGIDLVAERIVQIGARPPAFPAEWLERGELEVPSPDAIKDAPAMLGHLEASLGRMAEALHADIGRIQDGDPVSADILTEWLRAVEKDRWMIRAHAA